MVLGEAYRAMEGHARLKQKCNNEILKLNMLLTKRFAHLCMSRRQIQTNRALLKHALANWKQCLSHAAEVDTRPTVRTEAVLRMASRLQLASSTQLHSAFSKVTTYCKNIQISDLKLQAKTKLHLSNLLSIKARKREALVSGHLQRSFFRL